MTPSSVNFQIGRVMVTLSAALCVALGMLFAVKCWWLPEWVYTAVPLATFVWAVVVFWGEFKR